MIAYLCPLCNEEFEKVEEVFECECGWVGAKEFSIICSSWEDMFNED